MEHNESAGAEAAAASPDPVGSAPDIAAEHPAGHDEAHGAAPAARLATGEPRVDAALEQLDRLPELPVSDHPEVFERVHAQLAEVLGELDSGLPGPEPGEPRGG
jgi:hypothetical protein